MREMLYCYRGGKVTGMDMKKTYEAGICLLVATAAVGTAVACRHSWTFVVSLATYGVSAWIIVRCRPLYISLPLATLILWATLLGIPILAEYWRGSGSLVLPQVTSFPVYFPLILAGVYCCACYAAASVFYAVWSRQDRAGHFRTVIALISAAQLLLAMMGALIVLDCPHTAVFSSTLGVLFVCLGLGSLQGFLLGKVPAIKAAFMYFNGLQVVIWLAYLLFVERFAEATHVGCRCWGSGGVLFSLGVPTLALCVVNGIFVAVIPSGRAQMGLAEATSGEPASRGERTSWHEESNV